MTEQEHEIMIEDAAKRFLTDNKDELLKFVFDDSAKRVKQIYNQAVFQTNDYATSVELSDKARKNLDDFKKHQGHESSLITELKERQDEQKKEIADLEIKIEQIKQKQDGKVQVNQRILSQIIAEIEPNSVQKLYKMFESTTPNDSLVSAIECFVALLRNVEVATNVEVQIYLQDSTKLLNKMRKVKAQDSTLEIVQKHREALAQVTKSFKDRSHADFAVNHAFAGLICWAQNFCEIAVLKIPEKAEQDELESCVAKKEQLSSELEISQGILEVLCEEQYQSEAAEERQKIYEEFSQKDKDQALKYQNLLSTFQTDYINELEGIARSMVEETPAEEE